MRTRKTPELPPACPSVGSVPKSYRRSEPQELGSRLEEIKKLPLSTKKKKKRKKRKRSFRVGETWSFGETGAPRKHGCSSSIPHNLPHASHLAVSKLHPFTMNQYSSKKNVSLSYMSHANKLTEPEEGVMGTFDLEPVGV